MAISCFTLPKGNPNPIKLLQTRFHRRSIIEEIPEGRRPSFDQFLDDHYAATQQRHDSLRDQESNYYLNPSNASSPDRRTFYSQSFSPDRRAIYRYSSNDTVSVVNTDTDPRSPIPNHEHGHPRSPVPAISSFIDAASEETIIIRFTTHRQRDSKDTAIIPSVPLQQALKTCLNSHPAIVDNPPPFARYSEPPISHQLTLNSPTSTSPRPRINRPQSLHHLLHQRTQLHASRERLADRLEATTQDLSFTAEKLDLVQEELATREQQASELQLQWRTLKATHDGLLRSSNATNAELREVKAEHEACGRWFGLGRKMPWLRRYRADLRMKVDGLEAALKTAKSEVWAMHARFRTQEEEIAGLKEVVDVQKEAMQAKDEALGVMKSELGDVSGRLKVAGEALRREREVGDGAKQHCRDLQLEIACLKHRDSAKTV